MSVAVPPKIYDLLNNIVNSNIENYLILPQGTNKKGEGFLSDMNYVSLQDKISGKVLNFIVKQAPPGILRKEFPLRSYYLNEICLYDKVWPALQKFQRQIPSHKRFDKVAKCFATVSEDLSEKLVLENLKCQSYVIFDKKSVFDKEHVEYIFKQYGKFHAISFAYNELNPEEYSEISKELKQLWAELYQVKTFKGMISNIHKLCLNNLDPEGDAEVIEKLKRYVKDGAKIFCENSIYKGNYSAVLHGDCWSNNMMFKYDECKNLVDMRLIDFQFSNVGTPVYDLSYCLYSGATKDVLDELDYYLRVYHDSLSENIREFGCNPEELYPFKELKRDWKQYCKMGFTMAIMVWRSKLTNDDDIRDLTEIEYGDDGQAVIRTAYDEATYNERIRNLILHMYENEFL